MSQLVGALLESLQPSPLAARVIVGAALAHLGQAEAVWALVARRMAALPADSAEMRVLWAVVDALLKGAPIVFGPVAAPSIVRLVEGCVAWEAATAPAQLRWIEALVASWAGILPPAVWRAALGMVRQRYTQLLLRADAGTGGDAAVAARDELAAAWSALRSRMAVPAAPTAAPAQAGPSQPIGGEAGRGVSSGNGGSTAAPGTGPSPPSDDDDDAFDLFGAAAGVSGAALTTDALLKPDLPELAIHAKARQPRKRQRT